MSAFPRISEIVGRIAALGPRLPGSQAEAGCHRMVLDWLAETSTGSACVEEFDFLDWTPISQRLVSGAGDSVPAFQLGFSAAGDLEAELCACGYGGSEECRGCGGRIAVCSSGVEGSLTFLHRIQKYRNAVEAGAVAFVLVGEPGHPAPLGTIRKREQGKVPALAVGYEDGRNLLKMGNAEGRFRLEAKNVTSPGTSRNVVWHGEGRLPGIALCAHCDSWTAGAWDNASGVASLLALTDWLKGRSMAHRVLMCFSGAEEFGLFGSRSFCEVHAREAGFAVNVDGVGLRGAELQARCSDLELSRIPPLRGIYSDLPLTPWGDHFSFHQAGIRTVFLTSGGASPVQHTPEDTPDCINPKDLESSQIVLRGIVAHLDSIL